MVVQGEMAGVPELPHRQDDREVHHAEERARPQLQGVRARAAQIASKRFPLEKITTHRFG